MTSASKLGGTSIDSERQAHSQAILEGGGLGAELARGGRRKASPEGKRETSSAATQALGEVQSESPGRHRGWMLEGGR